MGLARRALRVLGAAVAVTAAAVVIRLAIVPSARTRHFDVPREEVAIPSSEEAIARGRHLSRAVAVCTICHGDDLGGKLAFEHPILGKGYTPNLTRGRGGIAARYSAADWVRALRHGVREDGTGLLFMPVDHYQHLRDEDLGAMIAYYRSLPPVDNERSQLELTRVARLFIDLGLSGEVVRAARLDHQAPRPKPPRDEGAYLLAVAGCTFCHGEDLAGGQGLEPGAPPGPDLTSGGRLGTWSFPLFAAVLRTGGLPEGRTIDPRFMPWQGYRHLTDAEIEAIWRHLRTLPPRR